MQRNNTQIINLLSMAESRIEPYVKQLHPIPDLDVEAYKSTRLGMSAKLFAIFNMLQHHFSSQGPLNILSLACGVPDEYFALKAFYQKTDCKLIFTGIDINVDEVKDSTASFSDFPELNLIACDATNIKMIVEKLKEKKCIPDDGFNMIFLRQPNILTPEYAKIFQTILNDVIPYVAAKTAKVFVSCYHMKELVAVSKCVALNSHYSMPKKNFVELSQGKFILFDEVLLEPDVYSFILHCKGKAFEDQFKLMQSSKERRATKPAESNLSSLSFLHHSTNGPMDHAHEQLLGEAKALCQQHPNWISLLAAINEKKYGQALRKACAVVSLPLVEAILKHKDVLSIDVSEPSSNGWKALDWLDKANANEQNKKVIRSMLLSAEAKKQMENRL